MLDTQYNVENILEYTEALDWEETNLTQDVKGI